MIRWIVFQIRWWKWFLWEDRLPFKMTTEEWFAREPKK